MGASLSMKTLDNQPNNLPAQPNALVGRQEELQTLARLLHSDEVRLVTLTGIGGAGKTRLALQTAADLLAAFPDGVFFAPLDQLAEPSLVAAAVAQALSLELSGGEPIETALQVYLRARRALLVLDNFEHLLPAASLVSALLAACPQLKVLATSREILHLRGEYEFPVGPLPLPDPRRPEPPERLVQFAAVALFIQRAQATRSDFSVDSATAPAVAEICASLDGLPLAIELAAARVRLFSPQVLLARLKAQPALPLLSGGPRDLPVRQQTLQNTLEWSYNLLAPAEQALFRRLGVFAGGFTLEAAQAVCVPAGGYSGDLLEGLASLVEKSLVRGSPGGDGQPRFSLLLILGQFARRLLEQAGELSAAGEAHAAYYLALAQQAGPELSANNRAAWFAVLEREHDNLQAALRWALTHQKVDTGLGLAGSLWRFWAQHYYAREGSIWIEQVLSLPNLQAASPGLLIDALKGAAVLAEIQGDTGNARAYHERSLALSRAAGDRAAIAASTGSLGYLLVQLGETQPGALLLEESIAFYRELGNLRGLAISLNKRAILAMDQNDLPLAQTLLDESLSLMRDQGDRNVLAITVSNLGLVELYQGSYARAKELLEENFNIHEALGQQLHMTEALVWIGTALSLQGNLLAARANYERALKAYQAFGYKQGIADALEGLAGVAGAWGAAERAARIFGAAGALREAIKLPLPPSDRAIYDRWVAQARARIKPEDFSRAWTAGERMLAESLDRAIEYALELDAVPGKTAVRENLAGLTAREAEILRLLAQGLADAQIAKKLFISPRTVNAHVTSIYSKLGVNSRAAATRLAIENGLA